MELTLSGDDLCWTVGRPTRSPGAGRAKLRLSRGFPLGPARKRHPPQILAWIISRRPTKSVAFSRYAFFFLTSQWPLRSWSTQKTDLWGGDVVGEGDARSPGSGGASPYLRRGTSRQPVSWASSNRFGFGARPSGRRTGCKHIPRIFRS
jgi:hypothetical protein